MKKYFFSTIFLLSVFSFSSRAQTFQVNGAAIQITPKCFRLTDSTQNQAGSIFNTTPINLTSAFDISFFMNFGCIDYFGADGISFLLHNSPSGASAIGGNGVGMGYTNGSVITPSLAVEFDTYDNTSDGGQADIEQDHISIQKNGDQFTNMAGAVQMSATLWNVEDCSCHIGRIQWNPSLNRLRVYFDGSLRLTYTNNIVTNYFAGNPVVYWGLTSATGWLKNIQTVSFEFADAGTNVSVCRGSGVQLNGTGGISYSWSPTAGLSNATIANPVASPTATTTYTLTSVNSTGCSDTSKVIVTVNPLPTVNAGTDVSICGGGSTTLSGSGTGATYLWSPITGLNNSTSLTPIASPTVSTTYTLTATTALGCTATDAVIVTLNSGVTANGGAAQAACSGSSAQFTASGGTSYSWSPSTGLSNSTISNPIVSATVNTTYTVTVTNALGCTGTDTVSFHINANPVANAGADVAICKNSSIQLNASGGTTYSWSPATGLSSSTVSNPTCFAIVTTTYTVTVTNALGCTNSDAVVVTVYPPATPPTISPSIPTICSGGSVTITASGAVNYSWYPSTGLSATSGAVVVANPTVTTTYIVAGANANGCAASLYFTVTVNSGPAVTQQSVTDAMCPGSGAVDINVSGGTGSYSYTWSNGATTQDLSSLNAGSYTVTVSASGCTSVNTYTVNQLALNKPTSLTVADLTSCSARLNWVAAPNMTYYKVKYKISGTTSWSTPVNVGGAVFYDFSGLAPATSYQFAVAGYCPNNATGGFVTKTGVTKSCSTPINFSVTSLTTTSAVVNWTAVCTANSFTVVYRKVGNAAWLQANTTLTSVTLTGLVANTTYEYKVKAICTGGNSVYGALLNFTTPVIRAEDEIVAFSFVAFPNPTSDLINIELKTPAANYSVELTNVLGQILWSNENKITDVYQIDLGNEIASGIYFLVYRDENRVTTQKVIVER